MVIGFGIGVSIAIGQMGRNVRTSCAPAENQIWQWEIDGHRITWQWRLRFVHFQDFVAVVVYDFDGDFAGLGLVEGAADGGIQG